MQLNNACDEIDNKVQAPYLNPSPQSGTTQGITLALFSWFGESAYAVMEHLSVCLLAVSRDNSFDHSDFLCGTFIGVLTSEMHVK